MKSFIVCVEGIEKELLKVPVLLDGYEKKAQLMKGSWIVITDDSAAELRSAIASDFSGRIAVFKTDRAAAWRNVMCESQWIKDNLA